VLYEKEGQLQLFDVLRIRFTPADVLQAENKPITSSKIKP